VDVTSVAVIFVYTHNAVVKGVSAGEDHRSNYAEG
jgi:hypothetical protein